MKSWKTQPGRRHEPLFHEWHSKLAVLFQRVKNCKISKRSAHDTIFAIYFLVALSDRCSSSKRYLNFSYLCSRNKKQTWKNMISKRSAKVYISNQVCRLNKRRKGKYDKKKDNQFFVGFMNKDCSENSIESANVFCAAFIFLASLNLYKIELNLYKTICILLVFSLFFSVSLPKKKSRFYQLQWAGRPGYFDRPWFGTSRRERWCANRFEILQYRPGWSSKQTLNGRVWSGRVIARLKGFTLQLPYNCMKKNFIRETQAEEKRAKVIDQLKERNDQ